MNLQIPEIDHDIMILKIMIMYSYAHGYNYNEAPTPHAEGPLKCPQPTVLE